MLAKLGRLLVALCAFGGIAAALGLASGALTLRTHAPSRTLQSGAAEQPTSGGSATPSLIAPRRPTSRESERTEHATAHANAPSPVRSYRVCAREEMPARLDPVALGGTLYAVHCGTTAHLVSIESERDELIVRRVAKLALPTGSEQQTSAPARIVSAELSEGGTRSLIVPTLRLDSSGAPVSGALFVLPTLGDGSLGTPSTLSHATPGDLAVGQLEPSRGQDIGVVQLADARRSIAAELWAIGGGASPLRAVRAAAGTGSSLLALTRLDEDDLDDVAVLDPREGRLRLLISTRGYAVAGELELQGARELHALDWDGDAHAELLVAGERVQRIVVSQSESGELQASAQLVLDSPARGLHLLDVDVDGKRDLVGYAHPEIVAWLGSGQALRTLARLRGSSYSVLDARTTHLDADGRWDLIGLATMDVGDPAIVLFTAHALESSAETPVTLTLEPVLTSLRDAPLARNLELR